MPNRPTESHEFFLCDRTRRLLSRQKKKKQKQNTNKIDWVPIQTRFPQKITKTLPLLRELSDASCMSQHVLRDNWLEIQLRNKLVHLVPDASKLDRAIHRMDYYPVLGKCYGNQLRYPLLDSVIQKFYCIFRRVLNSTLNYDEFGKQYTQWLWNHILFQCG